VACTPTPTHYGGPSLWQAFAMADPNQLNASVSISLPNGAQNDANVECVKCGEILQRLSEDVICRFRVRVIVRVSMNHVPSARATRRTYSINMHWPASGLQI